MPDVLVQCFRGVPARIVEQADLVIAAVDADHIVAALKEQGSEEGTQVTFGPGDENSFALVHRVVRAIRPQSQRSRSAVPEADRQCAFRFRAMPWPPVTARCRRAGIFARE